MNKTELAAAVSEKTDMNKSQATDVVNAIFDEVTNALSRNETVSWSGFGVFSQRHRNARTGRNPKTGETINIAASTSVGFKAGKVLKDSVNN